MDSTIKFTYLFKTVANGDEVWQKANIHIVPFQFVKNSYFKFLQGSMGE